MPIVMPELCVSADTEDQSATSVSKDISVVINVTQQLQITDPVKMLCSGCA